MNQSGFFLVLLGMLLTGTSAHLHAQNCAVPEVLRDAYEPDIKHLAVMRMEMFASSDTNEIEIPQHWQDTIWEGLAAIFHTEGANRDTVFDLLCIHHYDAALRTRTEIYVTLDVSASWYSNWADQNLETGNHYLDSLLTLYGFQSVYLSLPGLSVFRLETNQYIHMARLCEYIAMTPGVISSNPVVYYGEYSRIEYTVKNDGRRRFDFMQGGGDCWSGCTRWRTWSYEVDDECNVNDFGATGSTFDEYYPPYFMNCNISQLTSTEALGQNDDILIYPNPTDGYVFLDHESFSDFEIRVFDLNGRLVMIQQAISNKADLSNLEPGPYLVKVIRQGRIESIQKLIRL